MIQLKEVNGEKVIVALSGKKVNCRFDLIVGRDYLHRNLCFVRHIVAIDGDLVFYQDDINNFMPIECNIDDFAWLCPNEATQAEMLHCEQARIKRYNEIIMRYDRLYLQSA